MLNRLCDILFSLFGIVILLPVFILISILVGVSSRGGIFYRQIRVGKNNKDFALFKFRSMKVGADKDGLLTVGNKDSRITKVGVFLRKYKLDELPQLFNVLIGEMSLVGPRPEVRKYVELYTVEQKKVLIVRPGITDYASIEYRRENEILAKAENPEQVYINEILPHKLQLNLKYINDQSLSAYFSIIFKTIGKIF